jgi:hypothetical protein
MRNNFTKATALAAVALFACLSSAPGVAQSTNSPSKTEAIGMQKDELGRYIIFATTTTCSAKLAGLDYYKTIRAASSAFSQILDKQYGGRVLNQPKPLTKEQSYKLFSNEVAIQSLRICPTLLSPEEKKNAQGVSDYIKKRTTKQQGS